MNRNPRNLQLLSQIKSNPFAKTLAGAFDIGADYQRDMEALSLNRNWSPEGRRNEAQKHMRSAWRDLRDLGGKPLEEYRSKTKAMRATVRRPPFDKSDVVGAMNRRELRDASRAMTFGQRAGHLIGADRDTDFVDAVLEQPAWVSGIDVHNPNELEIYKEAEQSRLRDLHAPLLDAIAARETVESEVQMVVDVVRGDIRADCGLDPREFDAEVKAVESGINAHWLKRDKDVNGNDVILVLVPEGSGFRGKTASPEEVRDGHFFASHQEYLAARAA